MTRPEQVRRISITRQVTRREQASTERYTADEIVQAVESELEFQRRSYRNLRARRTAAQRAEWERKIAELQTKVRLLRQDLAGLRDMDLRMRISPEAFDDIERGNALRGKVTVKVLGREAALNYLDSMRRPGEDHGDVIRRVAGLPV